MWFCRRAVKRIAYYRLTLRGVGLSSAGGHQQVRRLSQLGASLHGRWHARDARFRDSPREEGRSVDRKQQLRMIRLHRSAGSVCWYPSSVRNGVIRHDGCALRPLRSMDDDDVRRRGAV